MPATTADLVQQFIDLTQEKESKEGDLEKVKERIDKLETELLARYERAGMQSMKAASGHTVFMLRQVFAGAKDKNMDGLKDALKAIGLDELVKEAVNSQRLSAWVREQEKELNKPDMASFLAALPEPLHDVLAVHEKYSIKCRRS